MAEITKAKINGIVKWFNLQKGYGYITDENGVDHFVHFSNITTGKKFLGLDSGDKVEFEIGTGKTGEQAMDVHLVTPAPKSSKADKDNDK